MIRVKTMTALEKWQSITQEPPVVEFISGLYKSAGVKVIDTGEEFTCIHNGDHIAFDTGIVESEVDYVVEIEEFQVDRLAKHAHTGDFDDAEKYRIISTLFTPATKASLKNPIFSNSIVRKLAGSEDLIHVHLLSPVDEETNKSHTLIFANKQWLVFPGIHGNAGRVYRLNLKQACEYQRHALMAMKAEKIVDLYKFSLWYREWRKAVSETMR